MNPAPPQPPTSPNYGRILPPLYLIAAVVLLVLCAPAPLERNQEARVLETAREMLHRDWHHWVLPRLNGQVRLQKPPLAYWLCAAAFELAGVGVWQGRLPIAAAGLGTLILAMRMARSLFSARAAYYTGATLVSSLLFLKYARLAETDILLTFFLTAAAAALFHAWSLYELPRFPRARVYLLYHLAALLLGLAILAKGPPVVFIVLLMLAHAAANRRPRELLDFVRCGAPLTLLVIGLPWLLYALHRPEHAIIQQEIEDAGTGRDHPAYFYFVPGFVLKAALPWTGFLLLALFASLNHWRQKAIQNLHLWSACIFFPLLFLPQRQEHYILPLLPPLFILIGWCIDRAQSRIEIQQSNAPADPALRRATQWVLAATACCALAGALAILFLHRPPRAIDFAAAALVFLAAAPLFLLYRRRGLQAALLACSLSAILAMSLLTSFYAPALRPITFAAVARQTRARYPDAPLVLYPIENYRLNFELRQTIPVHSHLGDLLPVLERSPRTVIISEQLLKSPPPPPPLPLQVEFPMDDKTVIRVYASR